MNDGEGVFDSLADRGLDIYNDYVIKKSLPDHQLGPEELEALSCYILRYALWGQHPRYRQRLNALNLWVFVYVQDWVTDTVFGFLDRMSAGSLPVEIWDELAGKIKEEGYALDTYSYRIQNYFLRKELLAMAREEQALHKLRR